MASKTERGEARLWLVPTASSVPPPAPRAFDDSELLAAMRRGDASAATALHDRLRPQVDRTVRRLLGARDPDFPDVTQQAMIQIVGTVDRYRGDCSLDSWT